MTKGPPKSRPKPVPRKKGTAKVIKIDECDFCPFTTLIFPDIRLKCSIADDKLLEKMDEKNPKTLERVHAYEGNFPEWCPLEDDVNKN